MLRHINVKHSRWNATTNNNRGAVFCEWILDNNIISLNNKQPTYQSPATTTTSIIDLTSVTEELSRKIPSWKITQRFIQ